MSEDPEHEQGQAREEQGQALTEYAMLLLLFASAMLAVSQIMTRGFAGTYEAYTRVMQWPPPGFF
jgi:Flp pilus assembly pilin Flp